MSAWVADGRIFALVLGVTVVEALGLILWQRRGTGGPAPLDILGQLSAGALLLLAAWMALAGAWWGWVGCSLAAAGLAHLFDLRRRWHGPGGGR